ELDAVHARHHPVRDDYLRPVAAEVLERVAPVAGGVDHVAEARHLLLEHEPLGGGVLDDENPHARRADGAVAHTGGCTPLARSTARRRTRSASSLGSVSPRPAKSRWRA